MVADTSEAIVWSLADALQERDPAAALAVAERLIAQGENVTGMVYALASRLRRSRTPTVRAGRPRPSPTSRSGAEAARSTATSWPDSESLAPFVGAKAGVQERRECSRT